MYPSYSNGNSYPLDQNLPHTEEEPPPPSSLFYNFPSPSIPYEDDILLRRHLHDLFLQHPPQPSQAEYFLNNTDSNAQYQSANEPIPMKKPSKKDRHSKIETAQGARDRRIRLSLEVAPQFFGLQDMLGFDKPGQTVSWLLNKSEDAIKELKKGNPYMTKSSSSNSEGEEGSGIDESPDLQEKNNSKGKGLISVAKEKKTRAPRKSAFGPLAKELREKAKTRAKERTREKKSRINETKLPNSEAINHEMNPSGSWNAFENCKESGSQSHNINPSPEFEAPYPSINVLFHYNQHNAGISQDEHQFRDYQADGKPWETYNSLNQF